MRFLLPLLLLLLTACAPSGEPPPLDGPAVGQIPLVADAVSLPEDQRPRSLVTVLQSHRNTVTDFEVGYFSASTSIVDTAIAYDAEMERYRWGFVDAVQFGDGGTLRRYHRGQERAILAFQPTPDGTAYALLYGLLRP